MGGYVWIHVHLGSALTDKLVASMARIRDADRGRSRLNAAIENISADSHSHGINRMSSRQSFLRRKISLEPPFVIRQQLDQLARIVIAYCVNPRKSIDLSLIFRRLRGIYRCGAEEAYGERLMILLRFLCDREAAAIKESTNAVSPLKRLADAWERYHSAVVRICDLFISASPQGDRLRQKLQETAKALFKTQLLNHSVLGGIFSTDSEENGKTGQICLAEAKVLNIIQKEWYDHFIANTYVVFNNEFSSLFSEFPLIGSVIQKVDELTHFYQRTFKQLCANVRQHQDFEIAIRKRLVMTHLSEYVRLGDILEERLAQRDFQSMRSLYNTMCTVDGGLQELAELLADYIQVRVKRCWTLSPKSSQRSSPKSNRVRKKHPPFHYNVMSLLGFRKLLCDSLVDSFESNRIIRNRVDLQLYRSLAEWNQSSRNLAQFVDFQMRRKEPKELKGAVELIQFVNKMEFERAYLNALAKAFLQKKRSDEWEYENELVAALKERCDTQFLGKVERMFKDMKFSRTAQTDFSQTHQFNGADLDMTVITELHWPQMPRVVDCTLPFCIRPFFESYKEFYMTKYPRRKLVLNVGLGFAELKATFYGSNNNSAKSGSERSPSTPKSRQKVLQTNTLQMIVLLLFNDHHEISFADFLRLTSLPERDLKRTLSSLTNGPKSHRILCRIPNSSPIIEATDRFSVNDGFRHHLKCIKLHSIQVEAEPAIPTSPQPENSPYALEAAIVRIMKKNGSMPHDSLLNAVRDSINHHLIVFSVPTVKRHIESLIERQYIRRDGSSIHYEPGHSVSSSSL